MKKKYMKPEMICITMATNMILAASPNGVNDEYSDSPALVRSSDSFWDDTDD